MLEEMPYEPLCEALELGLRRPEPARHLVEAWPQRAGPVDRADEHGAVVVEVHAEADPRLEPDGRRHECPGSRVKACGSVDERRVRERERQVERRLRPLREEILCGEHPFEVLRGRVEALDGQLDRADPVWA